MGYNAPEKTVTIAGEEYKGLNISGKAYAPVNRRVEAAQKNGGFSMVRCDFKVIEGIKCCEVEIVYKEQHYIGTAELRMSFGNPISDGQTSALGRALAFAGFDIETAIASAEDMEAVMNGRTHIVDAEPPALPAPALPPEFGTWQEYTAAIAKDHSILSKDEYLRHLAKATGKKQGYLTADYVKAVQYFSELDVVPSEQSNENNQ